MRLIANRSDATRPPTPKFATAVEVRILTSGAAMPAVSIALAGARLGRSSGGILEARPTAGQCTVVGSDVAGERARCAGRRTGSPLPRWRRQTARWRNVPTRPAVDRGRPAPSEARRRTDASSPVVRPLDRQQRQAAQAQRRRSRTSWTPTRTSGSQATQRATADRHAIREPPCAAECLATHDADPPPAAAAPFWYIRIGCWPF